jgi:tetratricopeptide (TPR) repeat protein
LLRNKLKDAFKEAQRAVALDSNYAQAHVVLGVCHLHMGEREKALDEADRAIVLKMDFADAYLLRSQALVKFTSGVLVPGKFANPEDRTNSYQYAADALEKYLQLAPASVEKQGWSKQLEALKFHLAMGSRKTREENDVYTSKEVTSKVRLTSKPEPEYTDLARSNQVEGTVILRAVFAADGTVKHIIVVDGLPDGLTWQSVRAAQRIKFVPATLDGRPVSMVLQLEYNFYLY